MTEVTDLTKYRQEKELEKQQAKMYYQDRVRQLHLEALTNVKHYVGMLPVSLLQELRDYINELMGKREEKK